MAPCLYKLVLYFQSSCYRYKVILNDYKLDLSSQLTILNKLFFHWKDGNLSQPNLTIQNMWEIIYWLEPTYTLICCKNTHTFVYKKHKQGEKKDLEDISEFVRLLSFFLGHDLSCVVQKVVWISRSILSSVDLSLDFSKSSYIRLLLVCGWGRGWK